ncbi:hypothetical protein LZ198_01365 [Myxococcus sp. K15C18031901]|uniref:hypothetical protein n=1 Tax=Myxococcus dinghuensis TaxID=2906761 RepID=UPI0020A83792|nr:hypothetical protein [Myxococcus dinghuensis]MCP3097517.1 hypothetical protein [Myxococcus dinghuensis]
MSTAVPTCPGCQAPRVSGPECPRCGVIYARAEARAARLAEQARARPTPAPEPPPAIDPAWLAPPPDLRPDVLPARTADWDVAADDATLELKLRLAALPVALLVGHVLATGSARFVARLFTMPLHELGHAVSGWLCGLPSMPTLWVTYTAESRSYVFAAVLAGALGALAWWGWKLRRHAWLAWGASLLGLQLGCTLMPLWRAEQLVIFGGDAGMMVLGTVLMASFYVREDGYVRRQGLRWGFLPLGALAFWDGFHTWWSARTDPSEIPFGEMEGVGLSDPSKLVEDHGWAEADLIRRYLVVGGLCLGVLLLLYGIQVARARPWLTARR